MIKLRCTIPDFEQPVEAEAGVCVSPPIRGRISRGEAKQTNKTKRPTARTKGK